MTVLPFQKPKHPTASELRRKYRQDSRIEITLGDSAEVCTDGSIAPDFLQITFYGPVALIPSMKNWKIPGTNFANPEVTARLLVMTDLFMAAMNQRRIYYGKTRLWCDVCLGKRPGTFDEDNGFAAVKDWLEPMIKAKRNRRWGIGISENDRYITGLAYHSRVTGVETAETTITIRPLDLVREPLLTFLARAHI